MTPSRAAETVWQALAQHQRDLGEFSLRWAFEDDPGRGERLVAEGAGWTLDYSKHLVDDTALELLFELARSSDLPARMEALFGGEAINTTEGRAVLHTALRAPRGAAIRVDDRDVTEDVHDVLDRVTAFADDVRDGRRLGHSGERFTHVVNLGIGGSDLGPRMVVAALGGLAAQPLEVRFVANLDPADLDRVTRDLDPARTLFVICSKTFTTLETLTNARAARAWCADALGEEAVASHFVAVSTNTAAVGEFGIPAEATFGFWDWVGGRFSLWSSVGTSIALALGGAPFRNLLAGARAMDEHFRSAPLEGNLPVLMALLGIWYRNLHGAQATAVVPYAESLARLPDFLQQLDMESNGKRVDQDGREVSRSTGPVVFGQTGTNAQHAFFQWLHQGPEPVPVDLIGFLAASASRPEAHTHLLANLLAQAEALAFGRSAEEVAADGVAADLVAHRTFPGNRPSSLLVAERLEAHSLGALLALYEHKVFVQGAIWGINSFDQWGVELGKRLAGRLAPVLQGESEPELDGSTAAWVRRVRSQRRD